MQVALKLPAAAGLLIVCVIFGSIANAQQENRQETTEKSPQPGSRSTLIGPVSIGFRVGILVGHLLDTGRASDTDTTVNPFRTTEVVAESSSSHVGWGPVIQINFTRRIALNVDLLHRGVGYGVTTTDIDEATDVDDAQFVSERVETVAAKFWDLALLPRYRFAEPGKPRPYVTAGFALRSLSQERGSVQTTDDEGAVETADLDVQPAHTAVRGMAIGAGVQIQDDVGFKLEIEFRYTRWFRRTFETDVVNSRKHQAEVLLGLTF
jgi:opacity protein-like surface antigen